MRKMKRRKTPPPPTVVSPRQRNAAVTLLSILGILAAIAAGIVLYAKATPAEAGIQEYIERFLSGEKSTGDPALDEMITEKKVEKFISPEDAVILEDLFEEEVQAISDDLHEDADYHAQQIECLIKAVFFEAGTESDMGKRWVFDVINNRLKQQWNGKTTYCDVIYDRYQFSFANAGDRPLPEHGHNLVRSRQVVLELYGNPDHRDATCGADHYINPDIATDLSWYEAAKNGTDPTGRTILAKVGKHVFIGLPDNCN